MIKPAATIDEVIAILQEIIDQETRLNSPLAYFPALYRMVTIRVKHGILNHEFDDGPRMEQLDVLFANRYILSYLAFKKVKPHNASWRIAFEANNKHLLILQHLLLGINAHINLDLGITTAETMKGGVLEDIHHDFNHINLILGEMTEAVQIRIGKVSPLIGLLDRFARNNDTILVNFSLTEARDGAWKSAQTFHKSADDAQLHIARDKKIAFLGLGLIYPDSRGVRSLVSVIRAVESKNIKKVVNVLVSEIN